VLDKWKAQHWQQITWRMGYTTLFDLLSRLKISSSNKEIERFVEVDIDYTLFHNSLQEIVSYLNGIHESYVAKAIGIEKYREMVQALPKHLQESFVTDRFRNQVEPLFNQGDTFMQLAA
jgi:hypothetical protein